MLNDYIENNNEVDKILEFIEQETKMLENKKQQLKKLKHKILEEKILKFDEFSKCSTFNINLIGNKLADLLTNAKGEDYKYLTCMINAKKYNGYDYVSKQNKYDLKEIPVRIIVPLKQLSNFTSPIAIEDFRNLLLDNYVIVIDKNEHNKLGENINFYDNDFNFKLNMPFENEDAIHYFDMPIIDASDYILIKEYIDEEINSRLKQSALEFNSNVDSLKKENKNLNRNGLIHSIMVEEMPRNTNEKILKKEKR